jgi:hypothetical protein
MCLLGDEGLWSGETLPSLSLAVDEGGVGGSVNPRNIKQCMAPFNNYIKRTEKKQILRKVLELKLKLKGRRPIGGNKKRRRRGRKRKDVVIGFKDNCQT